MIFGVCRGLADYASINVFWLRLIAVLAMIFTGFWPVLLVYLAAAIFMRPQPLLPASRSYCDDGFDEYYEDRSTSLRRIQRKFESLERRTRNVEAVVTDRAYDWDRRFNAGA